MSGHLKKNVGGHLTKNTAGHLAKCGTAYCCSEAPSDLTITLSGGLECTEVLNGTFLLLPTTSCNFKYEHELSIPENPCDDDLACYVQTSPEKRWWYAWKITITAELSSSSSGLIITVNLSWYVRRDFAGCGTVDFIPESQYVKFERSVCKTGAMTITSSQGQAFAVNPDECSVSW